jgi:hypothetical protein
MNADYNLALALVKTGDLKAALPHLRTVATAYPKDERIQNQYRNLEAKVGAPREVTVRFLKTPE